MRTFNTYGLFSINEYSFNKQYAVLEGYDEKQRNQFVTALRIFNLSFNILGYIPLVSSFSGACRIGVGLSFVCQGLYYRGIGKGEYLLEDSTFSEGDELCPSPDNKCSPAPTLQIHHKEAISTGISHIARGILEILPLGKFVNGGLDCAATYLNLFYPKSPIRELEENSAGLGDARFEEPKYWVLVGFLTFV
ncbi:MAG: hypothetical protein AAGF04_03030 [Chlamydiota bacterium]